VTEKGIVHKAVGMGEAKWLITGLATSDKAEAKDRPCSKLALKKHNSKSPNCPEKRKKKFFTA
jgi:hypothetical protein